MYWSFGISFYLYLLVLDTAGMLTTLEGLRDRMYFFVTLFYVGQFPYLFSVWFFYIDKISVNIMHRRSNIMILIFEN